jgi:PST family polysaccharide transporter
MMDIKGRKDILFNIGYLFANKGINAVVPLFLMPLIIEKYSVAIYGKLVYFQNISLIFMLIADYGFIVSGARDISLVTSDIVKRNKIASSILFVKLILCLLNVLAFTLVGYFLDFNISDFILAYVVLIGFLMQSFIPVWYFQGIHQNKYLSFANLFSKIILVLLTLFLLKRGAGLVYVQSAELVSYLICLLVALVFMFNFCKFYFLKPDLKFIKDQFVSGFDVFVVSVLNWCITAGVVFITKNYSEQEEFGYYATFSRLAYYLFVIVFPLSQALFPYFVNHFNSDTSKSRFDHNKILRVYTLAILGLIFVSLLGSNTFFSIVFKREFNLHLPKYITIFYILILWVGLVLYNSFLGIQFFVSKGLDKLYRKYYTINAFVSLGFSFILVPKYLSLGAAFSLFIGEFVILILYRRKLTTVIG